MNLAIIPKRYSLTFTLVIAISRAQEIDVIVCYDRSPASIGFHLFSSEDITPCIYWECVCVCAVFLIPISFVAIGAKVKTYSTHGSDMTVASATTTSWSSSSVSIATISQHSEMRLHVTEQQRNSYLMIVFYVKLWMIMLKKNIVTIYQDTLFYVYVLKVDRASWSWYCVLCVERMSYTNSAVQLRTEPRN